MLQRDPCPFFNHPCHCGNAAVTESSVRGGKRTPSLSPRKHKQGATKPHDVFSGTFGWSKEAGLWAPTLFPNSDETQPKKQAESSWVRLRKNPACGFVAPCPKVTGFASHNLRIAGNLGVPPVSFRSDSTRPKKITTYGKGTTHQEGRGARVLEDAKWRGAVGAGSHQASGAGRRW